MRFFTILLLIAINNIAFSQKVSIDLYAGSSNYSGDIQAKIFTFKQSLFAFGIGASYEFDPRLKGRIAFNKAEVWADDRFNPKNSERNLNFATDLYEGQVAAELSLLDLEEFPITPYVMGGLAVFHYNPYTIVNGQKIFLQPLSTEGQGMDGYPKPYKLTQLSVPFGGGFKIRLTNELSLGVELGFRKLFTDYLDDVSTDYADYNKLLAYKGQLATDLAWRQDEIKGTPYPRDGEQRGNPGQKDWYFMTLGRLSYKLGTGNSIFGNGGNRGYKVKKGRLGCPTNVL